MTLTLTKPFPRLWSLESGITMIVTDLHGDWDAYRRYRDRFVDLQAQGRADCLILTGDLIHAEDQTGPDKSLEIVLDVMELQANYGPAIIYLSGNHEIPHIYGISLGKGQTDYTPAFEAALNKSGRRAEIIALFDSLPFYVRTRAGVAVAHAGAAPCLADPNQARQILHWSHQALLKEAEESMTSDDSIEAMRNGYARMQHASYEALARYYLAVSGPDDPRYNDLLRGFLAGTLPSFERLLWPALFTRCEKAYGRADYAIFLEAMLQELSVDFSPQQWLVAGHMTISGGFQIIVKRHLRLASAHHATPREAGHYLLFDSAQPLKKVDKLLEGLGTVFDATQR